jgi:hypothetical protein
MKQEVHRIVASASSAASKLLLVALATLLLHSALSHARADYPIVSQCYAADPTGVEFNGRLYLIARMMTTTEQWQVTLPVSVSVDSTFYRLSK